MSRASMRLAALAICALLAGCGPTRQEIRRAAAIADAAQPTELTCERADRCALDSPLLALADDAIARSADGEPVHRVLLLERGTDALLARIHLMRSARKSIDVQSYIFAEDDAGYFVLSELLAAARRGVRVRVLLDQLFSVADTELLARLAAAHANFELRLYNPTFNEASIGKIKFVAGILCCFSRFNQRMHNKLLLVDDRIGITGGRNYQNRYFDWDPGFNYRDRDVLAAGPVARRMAESFDIFWRDERSVSVAELRDVAPLLLSGAFRDQPLPAPRLTRADRILDVSAQADSLALIDARFAARALTVGRVEYPYDLPEKAERDGAAEATFEVRALIGSARERVLLQTPYLVFSRGAKRLFRELHERDEAPQILVSTNSLASTDAFPVYALSHKYKRTYLREFGFQIHEYKPFPANAPIDLAATGAPLDGEVVGARATESRRFGSSGARGPGSGGSGSGARDDDDYDEDGAVPLEHAGVRISLHSKSLVIDDRVGMVGTHNFDPRSDSYNTESALVVYDRDFAHALEANILRDMLPENAWTIAPRAKPPVLSGLNYSLGKIFEALPLFDIWPWRYATSYELREGCAPLPPGHERFHDCYDAVGDFPEVDLPLKSINTRILTAFGAGLAPIL